jgi:hypothetical protein
MTSSMADNDESLGDQQTYEGGAQPVDSSDRSLGDLETGLDADSSLSDLDDLVSEFEGAAEIIDLETRYEIGNPLGKGPKRPSPWLTDKPLYESKIAPNDKSYHFSNVWRDA